MSASPYGPSFSNQIYLSWLGPAFVPATHRGLWQRLQKLDELQKLPLEKNRELQWRALKQMLKHAYDPTPFYPKRFDEAEFRPAQISAPADLEKIPPLTRDDPQNNLNDLWSRRYRREELLTAATGGTTDSPVELLRAPDCIEEKVAIQLPFDTWAGMWPGDKVFYLWGARSDYAQDPSWHWRLYDR
jgi:phenylacetate-CoA ligase